MTGTLDRIEARALSIATRGNETFGDGWIPAGHFSVPDVLALVEVAKAAQAASFAIWEGSAEEKAAADRLRAALARLEDNQ